MDFIAKDSDSAVAVPTSASLLGTTTWGSIRGTIENQIDLKQALDNKQNIISDLETIRAGAEAGATAVQDNNYQHTDNNYTTEDKNKLTNIEVNAQVNKIEKITLGGIEQSIENKTISLPAYPEVSYPVTSVAEKTGAVILTKNDVGLNNVDNTSDSSKNVATAISATNDSDGNNIKTTYATKTELEDYATEDFVNSSIATNTAYFIGTFDSLQALQEYPTANLTNNDYAFVKVVDETTTLVKQYDRYKWDTETWLFEYTLNNSSFTAEQWSAINSEITKTLVTDYNSHISATNNPHTVTKSQVGLSEVANERQYSSSNPPPYPVTSVNNKTGAVNLNASDVGAVSAEEINNKEDISNKITSISASSTNTQYPSAKLLYDMLPKVVR